MKERGDKERLNGIDDSILTPDHIEEILAEARANLERDGQLVPMLLMRLSSGEKVFTEVSLPATHVEKQAYFIFLGKAIRHAGDDIGEAILLSESWVVMAPDIKKMTVAPSQHPKRKEAIVIVARNALNNRSIFGIQTFRREAGNKLVFGDLEIKEFSGLPESEFAANSLLDYLFVEDKRILH